MALPATAVDLAERGHLTLDRPITPGTRIIAEPSDRNDLLDYEQDLLTRCRAREDLTVAHLSWNEVDGPSRVSRTVPSRRLRACAGGWGTSEGRS